MSIAEKLEDIISKKFETIADAVYEKGKADGGGVDLSKCKYIEKQATGKVIALNDVSEVYHKVKVYGEGQVDVYGKNLFDISTDTRFTQQEDGSYITNERVPNIVIPYALPYGTYILFYDMSCAVGRNARIRIHLKDGTSVEDYKVSTGEFLHYEKVITGEIVGWGIYYSTTPQAGELIIKNAQIEVGSVATAYEPCNKQTITATPIGTEANSMCPIMTFLADSDITVDYYSSFGMAEKELAMWNAFTDHGKREAYTYGFAYADYTGKEIPSGLCRPKITISSLFYNYAGSGLPKGVDCSGFDVDSGYNTNLFSYSSKLKHIYDLGLPALKSYGSCYRSCNALETIEIIRVAEWTTFDTNSFNGCYKLARCIFSGVIASDLNGQWCPFDDETLISLVEALRNLYEDIDLDTGKIPYRTITLHPDCINRLKTMIYPDEVAIEAGLAYTYYDAIINKGWNVA